MKNLARSLYHVILKTLSLLFGGGSSRPDLRSILSEDPGCSDEELASKINEAFSVMQNYSPLADDVCVPGLPTMTSLLKSQIRQ